MLTCEPLLLEPTLRELDRAEDMCIRVVTSGLFTPEGLEASEAAATSE